jgi:tetratricopeptide (TPR) repeat protein
MNLYLMILILGFSYALLFGFLSRLKREGISLQFTLEASLLTLLVSGVGFLTSSTINPLLFLVFIYLVTMRSRLLTDVANFLSGRGRQRDAIAILQVALSLFPDKQTRLIVLTNMGVVQLLRKNPASAEAILSSVLNEANIGGLGIRHEAACHYNLGIAFRGLGQEAKSVQHFREVAESFPGSAYGKAAQKALEERRRGKKKHTTPSEPED